MCQPPEHATILTQRALGPCPSSAESGSCSSKRPMHRTPPGCKLAISQSTLQPIKMPQISPQKLDKSRNKGATKPEVVFGSPYQQARTATLYSERCQGCLLVPLQFLAWPGHRAMTTMLREGQEKEKWVGWGQAERVSKETFYFISFCKF